MPFTYVANTPLSSQAINSTTSIINSNFQAINELISANHVGFNGADVGKHKWVTFPLQSSNPTATGANEFVMFNKNSTLTSQAELFIGRENNATPYEFTASLQATNGWTRLPSGILLKWGQQSYTLPQTSGSKNIVFPTGTNIPAFTQTPFEVFLTMSGSVASVDNNAFAYFISSSSTDFFIGLWPRTGSSFSSSFQVRYLAIGV